MPHEPHHHVEQPIGGLPLGHDLRGEDEHRHRDERGGLHPADHLLHERLGRRAGEPERHDEERRDRERHLHRVAEEEQHEHQGEDREPHQSPPAGGSSSYSSFTSKESQTPGVVRFLIRASAYWMPPSAKPIGAER